MVVSMVPVLVVEVVPFYGQVLLTASPNAEHPGWDSGGEPAVWSREAIAVSTVPDIDSDGSHTVSVEAWTAAPPPEAGWSEICRSQLVVSKWGIAVQDVVSSAKERAAIEPGEYEVTVLGKPAERPAELRIVLIASST